MKMKQIAYAISLLGIAGFVPALAAADQPEKVEKIEITGSSIKRITKEGALPVQVLKKEDIAKTGATSTVDLLQKLPTIQGSTGESASVGGGSFGFSGVSLHNIGETRTLVLLNGHRLALFGGQTLTGFAAGMDLNSIPISAIERVEVLTDGASALYGADAIAGVVNFITKRNTTDGDVTVGYSEPEQGGAKEKRITFTKGFGSMERDGFNVMISAAHDERTQLNSTQRDFAKTGKIFFGANGKNYRMQQFSASPIPANATDDLGQLINPYLKVNGSCPEKTFRVTEPYNDGSGLVDDYCGFDFVGELEIYPIRKRDSVMATANVALGENHELYVDALWSKTNQVSRIAPVPGSISIPAGSALHDKYLKPIGITGDSLAFYRMFDLGKRESNDTAKFIDLAIGVKGNYAGWDYNTVYTRSESDVEGKISGYPGARAVAKLRSSGLLDPFVGPGKQSAEAMKAINAANYNGYWDGGSSKLDTLSARGSSELFEMPSGMAMLGLGLSYQKEDFQSKPSLFAQGKLADPVAGTPCGAGVPCDQRFGDGSATVAYAADRTAYAGYAELILPAMDTLELSTALRYDNYSDFGGATTAKASFRWTPTRSFLLRGSVGNGFHAPTVPQVKAARQSYGVTSDKYICSAELAQVAAAQNARCQPGNRQYDQIAGGNALLQPEESRQATIGFRFEPTPAISFGADLWHVGISDVFGQLTEQEVFANPLRYPNSWGKTTDIGTGVDYLAFVADNQNLGKQYSTGLDIDISGRKKFGSVDFNSQFNTTYMIREVAQTQKNGPYYSSIGAIGELGAVTFRWQGRWTNSIKHGNWLHTLGVNFKAGYKDQATQAEVLNAAGNVVDYETLRLNVPSFFTYDWQTQWNFMKNAQVTVGVLNVLDRDPPLSISTGGANRGQQFGYDDRYYDSRGRTLYANFGYKF
ncbi:TonB-dependent siderophore receptor [Chitinimonas sp. BJYL2]|uniref:TonB-dependent receptor plug domain-containing protein n=1 Tax=Chitinimonas sp. BJYL2 TaxID=2976696 RepID=UPI0022B3C06C|nr:TonB-dependent receptor [Chitinimonas sp. BJYL2]